MWSASHAPTWRGRPVPVQRDRKVGSLASLRASGSLRLGGGGRTRGTSSEKLIAGVCRDIARNAHRQRSHPGIMREKFGILAEGERLSAGPTERRMTAVMKRSTDRILVTHAGSLTLDWTRPRGEGGPDDIRRDVAEAVQRQVACGVDVVNDG